MKGLHPEKCLQTSKPLKNIYLYYVLLYVYYVLLDIFHTFSQHEGAVSWKVPAHLQTFSKPVQPPRTLYKMELETAISGTFIIWR